MSNLSKTTHKVSQILQKHEESHVFYMQGKEKYFLSLRMSQKQFSEFLLRSLCNNPDYSSSITDALGKFSLMSEEQRKKYSEL